MATIKDKIKEVLWWRVCVHACVLGTCDILRVHSLPFGRESSIREATVGLKCDRYRVAGADQDGGEDVTTVCAWKWSRARRGKKGKDGDG